MARLNAVLLDLDDTLLDYSDGADRCWAEACAAHAPAGGVDAAALLAALDEVKAWFWSDPERHRRERVDMLEAWRKIVDGALARCGGAADGLAHRIAADFAERRRASWRLFPDAVQALQALRRRGVPLALVTNGDARFQREKIERWGLAAFFDCIVIEGEFGCGKPDPRVFHHALAALGVEPDRAWMVGDNLAWDVAGAQAVGVRAAWVDRAGRGLPAGAPAVPDRILRSLAELPGLVDR
ncbi:MAG: HAD family hydrolase [Candidatus Rokubacteria bacterium]|nr:HAD family hydrolase [Candidatus Rokubacteria bacterium]